jgi:hypothetical protein
MKRMISEWLWRTALLWAIGCIRWELHALRVDMQPLVNDQTTVEAEPAALSCTQRYSVICSGR